MVPNHQPARIGSCIHQTFEEGGWIHETKRHAIGWFHEMPWFHGKLNIHQFPTKCCPMLPVPPFNSAHLHLQFFCQSPGSRLQKVWIFYGIHHVLGEKFYALRTSRIGFFGIEPTPNPDTVPWMIFSFET
jgi:hypothetical protein